MEMQIISLRPLGQICPTLFERARGHVDQSIVELGVGTVLQSRMSTYGEHRHGGERENDRPAWCGLQIVSLPLSDQDCSVHRVGVAPREIEYLLQARMPVSTASAIASFILSRFAPRQSSAAWLRRSSSP